MPAPVSIFARVRKLLEGLDQSAPDNETQLTVNEQLEILTAAGASPYGEITKLGRSFEVHTTAAVAAVAAVPTTANLLSVWNGEPDGGRVLVIDRCWVLTAATTAATGSLGLIGALGQTRVASLASASLTINANNGNGGKDTKVVNSTTSFDAVTGVAANWRALPGQPFTARGNATTGIGIVVSADVQGRIIVPPGRLFGLHILADTTATTATVGIEWHERYMKLG